VCVYARAVNFYSEVLIFHFTSSYCGQYKTVSRDWLFWRCNQLMAPQNVYSAKIISTAVSLLYV